MQGRGADYGNFREQSSQGARRTVVTCCIMLLCHGCDNLLPGGKKLTSLNPRFAEVAVQGTGHAPAHDGGLVRVSVDEPEQLHLLLATGGGEAQSWKPDESKSGRRWVVTFPQDAEQSYCVANASDAFAHASGSGRGERARELEVTERDISHAFGDVTRWVNDRQPGPAWR